MDHRTGESGERPIPDVDDLTVADADARPATGPDFGQGVEFGHGADFAADFGPAPTPGPGTGFGSDFAAGSGSDFNAPADHGHGHGNGNGPATGSLPALTDSTLALRGPRASRDPLTPELGGASSGGNARVLRVTTSDYLLTVNPIDGTEVTLCPPAERPLPLRRTPEERVAHLAAGRPSPPPGPPAPELPLLERDEERERLIRLLARGRSVRVTGPSGAGRTALLESVANACADLAPDGVLWLSGYRRTPADVLQELFATVYATDGHRPDRADLPGLLRDTGAVVVIDDLEFGGAGLEELLSAAPECAFLMSATPDVTTPSADSMIEEVFLSGLTRVACVDLLQFVTGRPLGEDETAWAADLWFESEGLPLRFVQAGALLRQRDALRQPPEPDWDDSVWENGSPTGPQGAGTPPIPDLTGFDILQGPDAPTGHGAEDPEDALSTGPDTAATPATPEIPGSAAKPGPAGYTGPPVDLPLPSLAESAAPAELLASRLSESASEALAFAVALDGECPHPSHLPALVGDTHGDAALGELTAVGLAVPVSAHFRLAAGVVQQLAPRLTADGELSAVQSHTAALHYAWWTGHPSVGPERAAAESEAILAAMSACRDGGNPSAAVLLARTVAPAFAAALHWGAWERALRIGQEAARLSGEVAEEAYFHHELGVLALCTGNTDRARAELEASIALRGALADRQGTVVGRRTLALVNDRDGGGLPNLPALLELPPGGSGGTAPLAITAATTPLTVINKSGAPAPQGEAGRPATHRRRRNLVVVGTGVALAAALATIVTMGATSGDGPKPNQVQPVESAQQDDPSTDAPTDDPSTDGPTAASPSASATSPTPSTPAGTTGGPTTAPGAPFTPPDGGLTSAPGDTPTPPRTTQTSRPPTRTTKPTTPSTPPTTPTTPPPTTTPAPTDTTTPPIDPTSADVSSPPNLTPSGAAPTRTGTFTPPTTEAGATGPGTTGPAPTDTVAPTG
ncbi:ATP-binding protein [Streptomyces sp. NPDC087422]|uniref:ATP-binding protein n=1 Tax=Streptomyces sp. NPDC087422 TaxID=3365786 RepID=UPI0037F87CC5